MKEGGKKKREGSRTYVRLCERREGEEVPRKKKWGQPRKAEQGSLAHRV